MGAAVPSAKDAHLPCVEVGQEVLVGFEVGGGGRIQEDAEYASGKHGTEGECDPRISRVQI